MMPKTLCALILALAIPIIAPIGPILAQTNQDLAEALDALCEFTGIEKESRALTRIARFRRTGRDSAPEFVIEDFGVDEATWTKSYCPISLANLGSIEVIRSSAPQLAHGYAMPFSATKEWSFIRFNFIDPVEIRLFDTQLDRRYLDSEFATACAIGYAPDADAKRVDVLARQADAILQTLR